VSDTLETLIGGIFVEKVGFFISAPSHMTTGCQSRRGLGRHDSSL
jgi:hypothetical protein